MKRDVIVVGMVIFCLLSARAISADIKQGLPQSLKAGMSELIYSKNGLEIKMKDGCPSSFAKDGPVWAVTMQNIEDNKREAVIDNNGNDPEVIKVNNGFKLVYKQLYLDGKIWDVSLELLFSVHAEAFNVTGSLVNNEKGWVVTGFTGPVVNGIEANLDKFPLLMPCGLGQKFVKTPTLKEPVDKVSLKGALVWEFNKAVSSYELKSHYPSRFATMQWCSLSGENGGFYFGSHDKAHGSKHFRIRYKPDDNSLGFAFSHDLACAPGESWEIPSQIMYPYSGSWHKAADFYRNWFNTSITLPDVPKWAQNASGWMLTIMKQQNNEIMWDYNSLEELCKISEERGLDIIGLFGWTFGGHDRFYPDYDPDPAMGGREALVKALKTIRERGKRSIIYANGQLIDQNGTTYWGEKGKFITVQKRDGTLDYQKWHKYTDAPARFHGMACLGCEEWYERMLGLALQANDLGADGILYDQLAVTAPKFCYALDHGHSVPAVVYEGDRYRLLNRIANYMKTINPDFVIMTEGLCDAVLGSVTYFHGYENGAYVPLQEEFSSRLNGSAPTFIYPEMFKYTFPEVLTTYRNPAPVNNRLILNYATVYGLRSELEVRYSADVRYLKESRIPVPADYSNVISKPDINLVTSEDPVAARLYSLAIINFQRENSDLLWHGKYEDEKGIYIKCSKSVIAKAFVAGNRMGVVVWNTGLQDEQFSLDVPGYTFEYATEPGKGCVDAAGKLNSQNIRMLFWKKTF